MKSGKTVLVSYVVLCLISIASNSVLAQSFSTFRDFQSAYQAAPSNTRAQIAKGFFEFRMSNGGFPIVEQDGTVTFIYERAKEVTPAKVIGDFKTEYFYSYGWDLNGLTLEPLAPGSNILFAQIKAELDARFDYLFVVNGKNILDPLNPRKYFNGPVGQDTSQLVMPKYPWLPEAKELPKESKGTLVRLSGEWLTPISVYLPVGYDRTKKYPVIYTADGKAWDKFMTLPEFLDEMISEKTIEPLIAVMIDPIEDRRNWYLFNPDYLQYLEKVVRHIDREYSTKSNPQHRYHFGTSAGGRAAIYSALERPDLLLNVAMLSPSLTGSLTYFEPYFSKTKRPNPKTKIWMSAGTYEGYLHQDAKTIERYFKNQGLKVKAVYTPEGHSFQNWRHRTPEALRHFFARVK